MKLKEFKPRSGPNVISGDGILKLLSGSQFDKWDVMIREAVQNSWDARVQYVINFTVRGSKLSNENLDVLSEAIGYSEYGFELIKIIKQSNSIIEVSDSGTTGLTGPDGFNDFENSKQQRYLKFIYEVGNTQQEEGSGGTFGYGKEMADCFNKLFGRLIRLALYAILVHLVIDQKLIGLS